MSPDNTCAWICMEIQSLILSRTDRILPPLLPLVNTNSVLLSNISQKKVAATAFGLTKRAEPRLFPD